ncbi:hypothetical protein HID58_073836 [Brassica napus]|uniref:Plant thionin family protein n=1 Tax=Brassica napus TaxID=3708 RepID=A0ABQ7YF53_BRANA|nr:hypothetical protein HID58_073836 [Brassica napus]
MAKWSAMVVMIMMVTIVMVVTVESDPSDDYLKCYLSCALPCDDHDVDCLNLCKRKCSGIISHQGPGEPPAHNFRRYKSFYSFHLQF